MLVMLEVPVFWRVTVWGNEAEPTAVSGKVRLGVTWRPPDGDVITIAKLAGSEVRVG
jgi:hypothetical protein